MNPDHPLTARVTVNRFWQLVFGDGLVRTVNDFGLQGEVPTQPELLDWLAVDFIRSGWDVKRLLKLMVTSATYRQSSNFTPELLAHDPENRLLGPGPALSALGRIGARRSVGDRRAAGRARRRPERQALSTAGLWEAVSYNGDQSYEQDHGPSLYRRSLYTFWKRQAPPPSLLTFDGPTRETCTVRRARTNTPLQALVLLNDVTYVEAARGLATQMMRSGGKDPVDRLRYGFRRATGRWPKEDEIAVLMKFYQRQLAAYRERPQAAGGAVANWRIARRSGARSLRTGGLGDDGRHAVEPGRNHHATLNRVATDHVSDRGNSLQLDAAPILWPLGDRHRRRRAGLAVAGRTSRYD